MTAPSAEADLALVRAIAAQGRAAGADAVHAALRATDTVEVGLDSRRVSLLRTVSDDGTSLSVFKDGRKGSASITGRDPDTVAAAIGEALSAAAAAPPDTANGIAEGVAPRPPSVHGPDAADRDLLVDRALAHIDGMRREFPAIVSRESYHRFGRVRRSFANSAGLEQQETSGHYSFVSMFAAQRDGRTTSLNYAAASSYAPFAALADAGGLRRLYAEAIESFDAAPAPGKFIGDVILAPHAVDLIVDPLAHALDGYTLMAGTSAYKDKLGAAIASPMFSLHNRPMGASFPNGADFDGYGIPTRDLDVVEGGVLRDFLVDYYISRKLGRPQTAGLHCFVVPPGNKTEAEIVAETERGILITRFSGGSPNDNLDFSGIAKNAFYVEDGRIRHPLAETMISGNLRDLLLSIRAVSRETVDFGFARYPTIAARGVTIHGRA